MLLIHGISTDGKTDIHAKQEVKFIHQISTDGKTDIHAEQELKFIHQISQNCQSIKFVVLRHMETTLIVGSEEKRMKCVI